MRKLSEEKIAEIRRLKNEESLSLRKIADRLSISHNTVKNYLNQPLLNPASVVESVSIPDRVSPVSMRDQAVDVSVPAVVPDPVEVDNRYSNPEPRVQAEPIASNGGGSDLDIMEVLKAQILSKLVESVNGNGGSNEMVSMLMLMMMQNQNSKPDVDRDVLMKKISDLEIRNLERSHARDLERLEEKINDLQASLDDDDEGNGRRRGKDNFSKTLEDFKNLNEVIKSEANDNMSNPELVAMSLNAQANRDMLSLIGEKTQNLNNNVSRGVDMVSKVMEDNYRNHVRNVKYPGIPSYNSYTPAQERAQAQRIKELAEEYPDDNPELEEKLDELLEENNEGGSKNLRMRTTKSFSG